MRVWIGDLRLGARLWRLARRRRDWRRLAATAIRRLARAPTRQARHRPTTDYNSESCNHSTYSSDDDDDVKMTALNAIMQMDSERAVPILKQVIAKRDTGSVCLRRRAVFIVSQHKSSEVTAILLDAARRDPDLEVRLYAVQRPRSPVD